MKLTPAKTMLYSISISVITMIILSLVGVCLEDRQRIDYESKKREYSLKWKNDLEERKLEANGILSELSLLVHTHKEWNRFKEQYLTRLDVADDDLVMLIYLKNKMVQEFVLQYCDRNSKEKKLLRKYNALNPSIADEKVVFPYGLESFKEYKKSLPKDTFFMLRLSLEEYVVHVGIGTFILSLLIFKLLTERSNIRD